MATRCHSSSKHPCPWPPAPGWMEPGPARKCSEGVNRQEGPNRKVPRILVSLPRTSGILTSTEADFPILFPFWIGGHTGEHWESLPHVPLVLCLRALLQSLPASNETLCPNPPKPSSPAPKSCSNTSARALPQLSTTAQASRSVFYLEICLKATVFSVNPTGNNLPLTLTNLLSVKAASTHKEFTGVP